MKTESNTSFYDTKCLLTNYEVKKRTKVFSSLLELEYLKNVTD